MEPDVSLLQRAAGKQLSPAMGGNLLPFRLKPCQFMVRQFPGSAYSGHSPQPSVMFLHVRDDGGYFPGQELVPQRFCQPACSVLPHAPGNFFPDHCLVCRHLFPMKEGGKKRISRIGGQCQGTVQFHLRPFPMIRADRFLPVDHHAVKGFCHTVFSNLLLPISAVVKTGGQPFRNRKTCLLQMVVGIAFRFQERKGQKLICLMLPDHMAAFFHGSGKLCLQDCQCQLPVDSGTRF